MYAAMLPVSNKNNPNQTCMLKVTITQPGLSWKPPASWLLQVDDAGHAVVGIHLSEGKTESFSGRLQQ